MSQILETLRELAGLFVDDGSLAAAVIAVVVIAALSAWVVQASSLVVGAILLLGCLGVLVENVRRAAGR
jgi:hypothetical protein